MRKYHKSKDSIEICWTKLESIFDISSLKSSIKLRHKKNNESVNLRKSTNRSMGRSANDSPELSIARSTTPALNSSRASYAIQGLTTAQLKSLYQAKCEDLNIPVLPDQQFRFFSFCFKHFSKRRFDLQESGLGEISGRKIGEILSENSEFSYINLGKNMLGDRGCLNLLRPIQRNSTIVSLNISSNNITPEGSEEILKLISAHPSIISIDISSYEGLHRNRLCTPGVSGVSLVLFRSQVIQCLNINSTSIGEGVELMFEGLKYNKTLELMNIGNNAIGGEPIKGLMNALEHSVLLELNIASNSIANDGCEFVAKYLSTNPSLEKLDLSMNGISTKGARKLFDSLSNNSHLKVLLMNGNPMQNGPSDEVVYCLATNVTIEVMDLSNCLLKNQGALLIAEALSKNRSIAVLRLNSNGISDSGAEGLSFGFTRNQTLKTIDLNSNRIKDPGAIFLAKGLKCNCAIEEVNLKENYIKDEGGSQLCEITRTNKNIIKLTLDLNQVNSKCLATIRDNLKCNLENYQKTLPERIKRQQEAIIYDEDAISKVMAKIQLKCKEKEELAQRVDKNIEKFEEVKVSEADKLKVLQNTFVDLTEKSYELSITLEELQRQMEKEKGYWDRMVKELSDQFYLVDDDIRLFERRSKRYIGKELKEQNFIGKSNTQSIRLEYEDMLKREESIKHNVEGNLVYLKDKFADNKETLKKIKYPGLKAEEAKASSRQKSFLASEKLANTKKQYSNGPEFPTNKRIKTKSK